MKKSNVQFKRGDQVLYNGEVFSVLVSRKDFGSQQILYKLEGGPTVDQGSLIPATKVTIVEANEENTLKGLHAEYQSLYGKKVPSNKKNDEEWISTKIEEIKQANEEDAELTYDDVIKMTLPELQDVIEANNLDIDTSTYTEETKVDLVNFIFKELGYEVE